MHYIELDLLQSQGVEQLKTPIHITPARASKSAIRAVEKQGGTVFCKYYNDLALRDCLKGRTDRTEATPVRQTDIGAEYMTVFLYLTYLLHSLVHVMEQPRVSFASSAIENAARYNR